jgi:drug/metabolite transporter (DMT)-like permease
VIPIWPTAADKPALGITLAYSFAAAKDISIFTYASIIFTAIFGFILFGETPDLLSTIGYVVIISASLIHHFDVLVPNESLLII